MVNVLDIASIVCKTMNLENVNIVTSGGTKDGRGCKRNEFRYFKIGRFRLESFSK